MEERKTAVNFINKEGRYTNFFGERYILILPKDLPQWKKDTVRKNFEGWEIEEK